MSVETRRTPLRFCNPLGGSATTPLSSFEPGVASSAKRSESGFTAANAFSVPRRTTPTWSGTTATTVLSGLSETTSTGTEKVRSNPSATGCTSP